MIEFDSGIFHLHNQKISYVIGINSQGILEHLYFGKKITCFNRQSFLSYPDYNFQFYDGKSFVNTDPFYENVTQTEVGTYLRNDLKPASFIIRQNEDALTDFRFFDYKINSQNTFEPFFPHARHLQKSCQFLEIILKDARRNIFLHLYYTIFEKEAILLRSAKIVNETDDELFVERAMSLSLDLPFEDQHLIHFPGQWANERNFCKEQLSYGLKSLSSAEGRSGHFENPFFIVADPETTEDFGQCFSINLIYSGNFKNEIFVSSFRGMRIHSGISDENFSYRLLKGESFVTPEALLCFSASGLHSLSQLNHSFVNNHLLPEKSKETKAILFNSWEGSGMNFQTESMIEVVQSAKKIGAELFVLDDGWFSSRNDDQHGLGNWKVNENKINLRALTDECRKNKMKFGIWIEPEMVNRDVDRFTDEKMITHPSLEKRYSRNQLVLDFSNEQVVEEILQEIVTSLQDVPVDYIKYDMNRYLGDIYSCHTKQKELYHRYVLGVYRFMDGLLKHFPHILFENCASGGGRFDLGMLYFSPQIWCSDETDPVQRVFIQYGTSYGYPLKTIGSHVSIAPGTYQTKANIAFFGTYGYEMNPTHLKKEEISLLLQYRRLYHRYHKKVIEEGIFYRLSSPYEKNIGSFMCVDTKKETALVFIFTLRKATNQFRFLKLKGLNKTSMYQLEGNRYSGDYLMNVGLNLSFFTDHHDTKLLLLTKEKRKRNP